jgi:hypothetical protein
MINNDMMEVFAWLFFIIVIISVMVALLVLYLKRRVIKEEQESVNSNAKQITDYFGELLLSEHFLWTVWQGQAELSEMRILVRDELDNEITTIHCPTLLKKGNIRRWFGLDGEQYQQIKDSMTSVKMRYRRLGDSTTLYMSEWKLGKLHIYQGDGDIHLLTIKSGTVFSKYSSVEKSGYQMARIINSNKVAGYSKTLTSKPSSLTKLEQLIILTAF